MEDSILTSTKKTLGLSESFTAFDPDVLTFINSTFSTLTQLGIGPPEGILIEDENSVWTTYFPETDKPLLNLVKTYVHLKVKMLFDPPQTSFGIGAINDQLEELVWRLSHQRESKISSEQT